MSVESTKIKKDMIRHTNYKLSVNILKGVSKNVVAFYFTIIETLYINATKIETKE